MVVVENQFDALVKMIANVKDWKFELSSQYLYFTPQHNSPTAKHTKTYEFRTHMKSKEKFKIMLDEVFKTKTNAIQFYIEYDLGNSLGGFSIEPLSVYICLQMS